MRADLTGKTFGRWIILEYITTDKKSRDAKWLAKCECGTVKQVSGHTLKKGESKSCGCLQREAAKKQYKDYTGQKIGKLTVLERSESKKGRRDACWLCQCECGNTKVIRGNGLKHTRSCGCLSRTLGGLSRDKNKYTKYRNQNPVIRLRNNISRIIHHAMRGKKNGKSIFKYLPYTITDLKTHLESQFEPWMSWENYGLNAKDDRKSWWLDHIIPQSSFQFTSMEDKQFQECWALSNLRPLDKIENIIKGDKL